MANYDLGDIEVGFVLDGLVKTSEGIKQFVREIKSAEQSADAFTKNYINNTRKINGATFSKEELQTFKEIRVQMQLVENTRKQGEKSAKQDANEWFARQRQKISMMKTSASMEEQALREVAKQQAEVEKMSEQETSAWFARQRQKLIMMKASAEMEAKQARDVANAQVQADAEALNSLRNRMAFQQRMAAQKAAIASEELRQQQQFKAQIQEAINLSNLEYDTLEQKYNSAAVAAKHYAVVQQELTRAEKLGVITKEQLVQQLTKLEAEYTQFNGGMATASNRFSRVTNSVEESRKGFARYGMVVQQTGYQVGDFFVQIQSGTNALVAFGQQATQLVGLGFLSVNPYIQIGAAIGSVVIPLVTALGAMWMRSKEEVDKYTETIKLLQEEQKKLNKETSDLKFPSVADKANEEIDKLEKGIKALEAFQKTGNINTFGAAIASESQKGSIEEQKKLLEDQLAILLQQKRELEGLQAIEDTLKIQAMIKLGILENQREVYLKNKDTAIAIKEGIDNSIVAANNLAAAAANMQGPFAAVAGLASQIAANLWAAASGGAANQPFIPSSGLGEQPRTTIPAQQLADAYGLMGYTKTLEKSGWKSPDTSGGGGAPQTDPLEDLIKSLKAEQDLIHATEEHKQVVEALGDSYNKYSKESIDAVEAQIRELDKLKKSIEEQQNLWDSFGSALEDTFMDIITRTKSVPEAFRAMAYDIISELYKVLVVQRMVGSFNVATGTGTGIVGLVSQAIPARASGGPVSQGQPYLVGEKGPELYVPSSSGTIVNNSKTNAMLGNSGTTNQNVTNNITVTGSDEQSVRRVVTSMIPQIASVTMTAMVDAKRRGGQIGAAFN